MHGRWGSDVPAAAVVDAIGRPPEGQRSIVTRAERRCDENIKAEQNHEHSDRDAWYPPSPVLPIRVGVPPDAPPSHGDQSSSSTIWLNDDAELGGPLYAVTVQRWLGILDRAHRVALCHDEGHRQKRNEYRGDDIDEEKLPLTLRGLDDRLDLPRRLSLPCGAGSRGGPKSGS